MAVSRELERFPTRNFPYRADAAVPAAVAAGPAQSNVLFRRVLGLDASARPMTAPEMAGLDDPFGRLLRSGRPFPLTLRNLVADIDGLGGTRQALPDQLVFLAADGGHIPWTPETDKLRRSFRLVVARGRGELTLLVSSSTALDSAADAAFLQVAGWDATHEVFHYYERLRGTYFWAGMSHHALEDATRGRGPFDSHVNGSLVMKELRSPWIHWHAPQAGINEEALAPDDPLRDDPLFRQRATAERLEIEIVRPAIRRWNEARVRGALDAGGSWRRPRHFLRQAVTDTTVNLATSETASHVLTDTVSVRPPLSFFLNRDTLFDTLALEPDAIGVADIAIPGDLYRQCLQRYDVHRSDGSIRIEGDSHFAFLVPEPAFEDTQLVDTMVREGLLSPRFVACLSMVDFTNPVFSQRRAALVRYTPEDGRGVKPGDAFEAEFVAAVGRAVASGEHGAGRVDSPEREFLANWQAADHRRLFTGRITDYLKALMAGMADAQAVDGWFRLVEYRRRCFRKRPLSEFALSTPRTNISETAPALRMSQLGRVESIADQDHSPPTVTPKGTIAMQRFDPPGFLDDFTESEKEGWSRTVSGWLDRARAGRPSQNDGPRSQFFNPLTNPPAADAQVAIISWNAFPRQIKKDSLSDTQRWRRADADRAVQDEYCEWSVARDPITGKIVQVTFTCEGPEYWEELAAANPDKVLALYQQFVSPAIRREDLFVGGVYQPRNPFNSTTTRGAMHLVQDANTLTAEIELGAAATIRRRRDNRELTGAQELIECSRYGEPGRNSDPHIGEQINALARRKAEITLNNPVGLYFHEFNPVGWITPDGADPRQFWKFVRGKDGHFVRAVFEVPAGRGYVAGDIKIGGRRIDFGAQIVDFITIKLEGIATRIGQSTAVPFDGCRGQVPTAGVAAGPPNMTDPAAAPLPGRRASVQTTARAPSALAGQALAGDAGLLARLPAALRGQIEPSAPEAIPPALLPYPHLEESAFAPRPVSGKIMAYASPDSTYAVTKKLIDSARRSIVIAIYDFSASYMEDALKRAMQRGVTVSLMLDTNSDDERELLEELAELGATCVKSPSSSAGNPNAYFGNAHQKIVVIDGAVVMIQSGNWSDNSIPFNEGDGVVTGHFAAGNRDMGLAVHSRSLAKFFAELVARDMRLAQGQPPDAGPPQAAVVEAGPASEALFFEAAPPAVPEWLFPSLTVTPSTPVTIAPVVTPENFHATVKGLLRSAKRSLRIEQQYIRGGQPAVEALLDEIAAARAEQPELEIKVIVSLKFLSRDQKAAFEQAMARIDLQFDDNYRYLSRTHFVHCHNKLIVVDGAKVLLGSQNWSTTGLLTNRETSLLVDSGAIASYFARIFDADWDMSVPTAQPPELTEALDGLREARDFAGGNVVVSNQGDYRDV